MTSPGCVEAWFGLAGLGLGLSIMARKDIGWTEVDWVRLGWAG